MRFRKSSFVAALIAPARMPTVLGMGWVRMVSFDTTPNVPPPPPRSAQNRSACCPAFATRISPEAVTTSISSTFPAAVPYRLDSGPKPPPWVNPPAAPTLVQPPP